MIGIPLGLVYSNIGEWVIHKYVLHAARQKKNFWSFHWHEHHRAARENNQLDPHYQRSLLEWNAQSKEVVGLSSASRSRTSRSFR